jgi:hypothetical protein
MVFPYLKGLVIIKCGFFYLVCGSIVYSVFVVIIFVDLFRFLTELRQDINTMTHGTSPWRCNIVVGDIITIRPMLQMIRKKFMTGQLSIKPLGPHHNEQNRVHEGFIPIASDPLPSYLFIPSHHAPRTLLLTTNLILQTKLILHSDHHIVSVYFIVVPKLI